MKTGDVLHVGQLEGYRHASYGMKKCCRERSSGYGVAVGSLRLRANSGYYSAPLVHICGQRKVEYFIVMSPDWLSFQHEDPKTISRLIRFRLRLLSQLLNNRVGQCVQAVWNTLAKIRLRHPAWEYTCVRKFVI